MAEERVSVSTPAGEIAAWRGGAGAETAVLLHGGPGMADYLDSLAPLVGEGFRTVRYQQRGLAPTTIGPPYTVEAHVEDAVAVIDQAAGGRAWIVGHSWGGHLALHMLVACPERLAGAVIVDPLGADLEVLEEFGRNLRRGLDAGRLRRLDEIDARENAGRASEEESLESLGIVWPNYHADPAAAGPMPPMRLSAEVLVATFASVVDHTDRGTLQAGLPRVPATIPVIFVHGAQSPMPVRTSRQTAALIPHALVDVVAGSGHFVWYERPDAIAAALHRIRA
ncbi:MAG TPA: alpha/beta hydrolase [Gaiellales bacterium]